MCKKGLSIVLAACLFAASFYSPVNAYATEDELILEEEAHEEVLLEDVSDNSTDQDANEDLIFDEEDLLEEDFFTEEPSEGEPEDTVPIEEEPCVDEDNGSFESDTISGKSDAIAYYSTRMGLNDASSGSVLSDNGVLYSWGNNTWGQIGNGKVESGYVYPQKVLTGIDNICVDNNATVAVTKKGEVLAWGSNYSFFKDNNRYHPTPENVMTGAKKAMTYSDFHAAIMSDNTCYTFGEGYIGNGYDDDGVHYDKNYLMPDIKDIVAKSSARAVIDYNDNVYIWGNYRNYLDTNVVPVLLMRNAKQVSLGRQGTNIGVLSLDGKLYAAGSNWNGTLGNGTNKDSKELVKVMDHVRYIDFSGDGHACAITENNDLYVWGYNSCGQVGDGTTTSRNTPVKVLSNVKYVAASTFSTAAITYDGDLYVWGRSLELWYGNKSPENTKKPKFIASNVQYVVPSEYYGIFVSDDNILYDYGIDFGAGRETVYKYYEPTPLVSLNGDGEALLGVDSEEGNHEIVTEIIGKGKINHSLITKANDGDSKTYVFTPDTGYTVYSVVIDGHNYGTLSNYRFENIREDHKIVVTFKSVKEIIYKDSVVFTFDPNGGTGTTMQELAIKHKESATIPYCTYEREGYAFDCWNTSQNGMGDSYHPGDEYYNESIGGEFITLYAQWKKVGNGSVITYVLNGGINNSKNLDFVPNKKKATLYSPTRKGYTFVAWYKDVKFKNKVKSITGKTGKNFRLYAKWKAKEYKIHYFNPSGTKAAKNNPKSYKITDKTRTLNAPSRAGYKFAGWYKDEMHTQKIDAIETGSYGTLYLYSAWIPNTYTVRYIGNGATGGETQDTTHGYKSSGRLASCGFTKEGYSFDKWYKNSKCTGTSYASGYSKNDLTNKDGATVTLYVKWKKNKYTVRYDSNGGKGSTKSSTFTYNQKGTLAKCGFTKTGYKFAGWLYDDGTSSTLYKAGESKVFNFTTGTGTVTLTAQWTPITYKIAFAGPDKKQKMTTITAKYGEDIELPRNTFTKKGYYFNGWSSGKKTYADGAVVRNLSSKQNATVTLTARWTTAIKVSGISFDITELNKHSGQTEDLMSHVVFNPGNATNRNLSWASSDNAVATVNDNGLMTTVNTGVATITATTKDGSNKRAEITVTVINATKIVFPLSTDINWVCNTYANHGTGSAYSSIDINKVGGGSKGNPVYAMSDGVVHSLDAGNGQVNLLHTTSLITTNNVEIPEWYSIYAHMSGITVQKGDTVKAGQIIGYVDQVGQASGPHLHINIEAAVNEAGNRLSWWAPEVDTKYAISPYYIYGFVDGFGNEVGYCSWNKNAVMMETVINHVPRDIITKN